MKKVVLAGAISLLVLAVLLSGCGTGEAIRKPVQQIQQPAPPTAEPVPIIEKLPPISCRNDCDVTGQIICVAINATAGNAKVCGNYDADSCLEWKTKEYCKYGCYANNNGSCKHWW